MNEYGKLLAEELSAGMEQCKRLLDNNDPEITGKKLEELTRIYDRLVMQVAEYSSSVKILRAFFGAYGSHISDKTYLCREIANKSWEKIIFLEQKGRELREIKHRVLFEIGKQEYKRGMFANALNRWEEVLKEDPGNEQIHQNLREIILEFSE